jgi:hypothetical protein
MDPFDRAERCRARADELRAVAAGLHERDAKAAIRAVAHSFDLYAHNLETAGVNFRWGHRPSHRLCQSQPTNSLIPVPQTTAARAAAAINVVRNTEGDPSFEGATRAGPSGARRIGLNLNVA